jgi:formylmethanofuran dehydrogenase subunit E
MSMKDFINTLSKEQRLALLAALKDENEVSTPNNQEEVKQENNSFIVDPKKNSNNRRREQVRARKNEWVDEGEFRDMETKYGERSPRNRKPSKKIDVECSVCGRSFKTDPKYVYGEYHRCSRCVGK